MFLSLCCPHSVIAFKYQTHACTYIALLLYSVYTLIIARVPKLRAKVLGEGTGGRVQAPGDHNHAAVRGGQRATERHRPRPAQPGDVQQRATSPASQEHA